MYKLPDKLRETPLNPILEKEWFRFTSRENTFQKGKAGYYLDQIHQEELLADWELAVNGQVPFKIKGLDQ